MKQGMHGVTLQEKPLSAYVEVIQIADKAKRPASPVTCSCLTHQGYLYMNPLGFHHMITETEY